MDGQFMGFLMWLMGIGGAVAASFVLERIPAFQNLSSEMKKFVAYGVAGLIGVGAYALVTFAPDLVVMAEPYFAILAMIFTAIFGSNVFHKFDKSAGKG